MWPCDRSRIVTVKAIEAVIADVAIKAVKAVEAAIAVVAVGAVEANIRAGKGVDT